MHALSRTYSAFISEGTGASAAEADIAAILPDIPRDAAALLGPKISPPGFFRDGARGFELSGPSLTASASDPAAIAGAAATAAVSAVLKKPSDELGTTSITPRSISFESRPRQSDSASPSRFTITASTTRKPKKPFSHALFGGPTKQTRKSGGAKFRKIWTRRPGRG
jgi:hypothetical protein